MTTNRRERFRAFMERMDPTSDPGIAFSSGYYVEPPYALGRQVANSLEIDPDGTHLIVGGVGSGKSSELHRIEQCLSAAGDVVCFRLDVLAEHRHSKLDAGVLIGLAAAQVAAYIERETGNSADPEVQKAATRVNALVNGRWADRWELEADGPDYEPDDAVWVEGIIKKPVKDDVVTEFTALLGTLVGATEKRFVMLFDGLDRVHDLTRFVTAVARDVPSLRNAHIGAVVVGPQQLRLTAHKRVIEGFTKFYLHGAAAYTSEEGREFLARVLRQRDEDKLIPDEMLEKLATWSGGLVRDLISLARAAADEAYSEGKEQISREDIDAAADQFGRNLLLSGTPEMGERLKELVPPKSPGGFQPRLKAKSEPAFVLSSEVDIEMLVRRLIIEVPGAPVRYVPHPTLVPLVRSMGRHA